MKLTTQRLKKLIQEELNEIDQAEDQKKSSTQLEQYILRQLKENSLNLREIQNSAKNDSTFQEIFRLMHSRQTLIQYINNRWELSQWGQLMVN